MPTYLLSLWLLLSCASCASLPTGASASFGQANERLRRGDYAQAIRIYQQLEQQGVRRAELYCNIGNAYYQLGQVGWAVYYYEKGLALAPLDKQLLANKKVALPQLEAPEPAPSFAAFLSEPSVLKAADVAATIAVLGLVAGSIAFLISGFMRIDPKRTALRALGRYLLLAGGLVVLFSGGVLFSFARHQAIIVQAKAIGRAGPSSAAREVFSAKAGEKVTVQSQYAGWAKVKTQQGEEGWLAAPSVASLER